MEQYTIGLLNDSFPPSVDGVSNTVVNYAKIIEKDYGHSFVVTPNMAGHDDSVYPFPVYRYPSINTVKQLGFVTGVPVDFNVRKDIIESKPDLMHVHCPTVSLILARGLRETLDCPLVFTYHTKFDVEIQRILKGKPI